jgi:hypothetical protein
MMNSSDSNPRDPPHGLAKIMWGSQVCVIYHYCSVCCLSGTIHGFDTKGDAPPPTTIMDIGKDTFGSPATCIPFLV